MINLINSAQPQGLKSVQEMRRSGDEGSKDFSREISKQTELQETKKSSPSSRPAEQKSAAEKRAEKSREVEDIRTSPSRPKKTQGSKEQVFQEFMDSLESDIGISSARLAEALAQVASQEEGQLSPEDTADLVIEKLNLPVEKEDQAKQLYAAFLVDLNQVQKPLPLIMKDEGSMMVMQQPHVLERFQQSQEKKASLNESLDHLNEKFWMTGAKFGDVPKTLSPEGVERVSLEEMDPSVMAELEAMGVDPTLLTDKQLASLKMPQNPLTGMALANQRALQEQAKMTDEAEGEVGGKVEGLVLGQTGKTEKAPVSTEEALAAMFPHLSADLKNLPKKTGEDSKVLNEDNSTGVFPQEVGIAALGQQESGSGNQDSFDSSLSQGEKRPASTEPAPEGFDQALSSFQTMTPAERMSSGPASAAAAGMSTAGRQESMGENSEASIQAVMNQAQYLIKKGGGEMSVKMTPEGLGEIHLKVAMNDGKVNVQLSTETAEAKKLFESNISELKAQLGAQKLSMESLKVDVVHSTNTDQNIQSNLNSDQGNPQQTRQFWNQFQESFGNRSQRDGYFDFGNTRKYGERDKDPLQPVEAGSGRVSGRRFENKGRGLNVVA